MVVVDARGTIVACNQQLEALFGYGRDELQAQPLEVLIGDLAPGHRALRDGFMAHPTTRSMGAGRDLFGRHRDGHPVPVEIGLTPMRSASGDPLVVASIVDLTERRRHDSLLRESLAEKEMLLRELHHRSKNNLQLIASMLDLASQQSSPEEALHASRERINSISLIHEQLYQSKQVSALDFSEYAKDLVALVEGTWGRAGQHVSVRFTGGDVRLGLDRAIPAGLLLNELVSNAYKHAFPEARDGTLEVRLDREADEVRLSVLDDGVGLPEGKPATGHIGLELVNALTRQLRGTLRFERGAPGTHVHLRFPGGLS